MRISMMTVFLCALMFAQFAKADAPADKPDDNAALQYWCAFAVMPTLDDYSRPKIETWDTVAINDSLRTLLATYANSFHVAQLGAAKPRCDWGISMEVDGPFTLLPYLGRGRELSRAMLLAARVDFADGKRSAGADDLITTIVLARHLGAKGPMVSLLVQDAIENNAITLAAANLSSLSDTEIADFAKRISNLPAPYTLAGSMTLGERMSKWGRSTMVGKSDAELAQLFDSIFQGNSDANRLDGKALVSKMGGAASMPAQFEQIDAYYSEAAKISALPWEQFKPANADMIDRFNKSNAELVKLQMVVLQRAKETEVRTDVKRQMLDAAIARRTGGENAFRVVNDPTTDNPFEIVNRSDGGFTLKSSFDDHGNPTALDFPGRAGK